MLLIPLISEKTALQAEAEEKAAAEEAAAAQEQARLKVPCYSCENPSLGTAHVGSHLMCWLLQSKHQEFCRLDPAQHACLQV